MDLWSVERELLSAQNGMIICGVDEAGRGPLAGPVYAAAVILPPEIIIEGLNDSKKLSEKKREKLFDIIISKSLSYGIASASETEIDEMNILNATFLAMNRAIGRLKIKPDIALIDGNRSKGIKYNNKCIVGGDGKSASIAAASILAKVSRDRYMRELGKIYPEYYFEKHKGYGTKLHYEKIKEFGVSKVHRKTFLKKCTDRGESAIVSKKLLGRWGEEKAVDFLRKNKYSILGVNYYTRFGEIDIIAENKKYVIFIEVKLRINNNFGEAREFVNYRKQEKIKKCAQLWLMSNETEKQIRFDVIEIYAPESEKTKAPVINHILNAFIM